MDELAATNRERWNALVTAQVQYAKPFLNLTPESARTYLDEEGLLGDMRGKRVLCLATGGGQQSVAFALLGADVTVFDLADKQLEQDQLAANHYGLSLHIVQGDMRHLDMFANDSFDLVYQAYSINFVPDIAPVFAEVARVIQPCGIYRVQWANPFVQTVDSELDPSGTGYLMRHAYLDGREVNELFPDWTIEREDGTIDTVVGPREFVHTLRTFINTLVANAFVVLRCNEHLSDDQDAPVGSWSHYTRVAPPYLALWTRYLPIAFCK